MTSRFIAARFADHVLAFFLIANADRHPEFWMSASLKLDPHVTSSDFVAR
jgi:hypothetical protein